MKNVSVLLTLTIEDAEVILWKMRTLASNHILNGEDEEALNLLYEIKCFENKIKEAIENECTEN